MGFKAVRLLSETLFVFGTIVMAVISLYASQARFFNPQTHVFASLIGLFAILFIVLNLFLTFYWASKFRAWFFVSIATLLLFIPYTLRCFKSHSNLDHPITKEIFVLLLTTLRALGIMVIILITSKI